MKKNTGNGGVTMNEKLLDDFRCKIAKEPVFGPFMKTGDPAFVEAAGYAGCDFAILDREHGPSDLAMLQNHIRAAQLAGMLPIVRVRSLSETEISGALDIGAAGVQIPQVCSAAQAREAVRAARFYPQGERGVCRFVRAAHYSVLDRKEYFERANRVIVVIQVEGKEAVVQLDEILDVEGIDILFIGPYDLSQSLGVPGQTMHPLVIDAMEKITYKAAKKGITVGAFTDSRETLKLWMNAGVKYLSYSVDVGIFSEACSRLKIQFAELARAHAAERA